MAAINSFESVVVGNTATATVQFILTPQQDITNAYVTYELLDEDGVIYSSGNGNTISIINKTNTKLVQSLLNVQVPSSIPTNVLGTTYQVRISLTLNSKEKTELYSNLTVLPETLTYQGVSDVVDIKGSVITSDLVIESLPSAINALIYFGNDILDIAALTIEEPVNTSDGYLYRTTIDTNAPLLGNAGAAFYPSLTPHTLMWQYILNGNNTETASIWIVTPTILMAAKDLLSEINKARSGIRDKPTFSVLDALLHLRLGGDTFNALYDPTNFTYLNASGQIRSYWLGYSKVSALRAQQLFEAESAFDFQGQAISLTVDRVQYYESMASTLESSLNDSAKPFKAILSKRGNINGDGNVDPTKRRAGSMGCVGITLSPVSRLRPFGVYSGIIGMGQRSIF